MISYDEFKNIELKIADVLSAERVEGSEKLLKLQIRVGEENCQIVSGIGKVYEPESLIGKQVVIVANLAPRSLMGLESQGMLLAADSVDGPVLLMPDKQVVSGVIIK